MEETKTSPSPRPSRSRQSGQSLVELALSTTILILVFSGAVDLGRAYFVRINMLSAVGEGAHWAAAYPGCVLYGSAFGQGGNVVNMPATCRGTNSIMGRIANEENQLSQDNIVSVSMQPLDVSKRLDQMIAGDTLVIDMQYKMVLITPVLRSMFGDTLTLEVKTNEVVRGDTMPPSAGRATTYTPVSDVPMVQYSDLSQQNASSSAACTNGYPTLKWSKPPANAAWPSGIPVWPNGWYEVVAADSGTGSATTSADASQHANATSSPFYWDASTSSVSMPQIPITSGGSQMYAVRAAAQSGSPLKTYYSDYLYILTSCVKVQPSSLNATCNTAVGSPAYTPSITFTWQEINPEDLYITGYKIHRTSDNGVVATIPSTHGTSGTYTSYSYTLTLAVPPTADLNKSNTYYIVAYNSTGGEIGLDNSGNTAGGSRTLTTSDVTVACTP